MWKKPITFKCFLLVLLLLSAFVLCLVISASSIYFSNQQIRVFNKLKNNFSTLPQGFQSYSISTDSPKNLQIIQVDIDPLDVGKRKTQTVIVYVEDIKNNPITEENKVEAIVYQDNISTPFSFDLKKIEGPNTSTISIWQGSWKCEDTHNLKYMMTITAKTTDDNDSITLTFR
jgi:hypothetical protein